MANDPNAGEEEYQIRVVGAPHAPLRDLYHALLRISWPATLALVVGGYLTANALFALGYLWVGGVAHARPGSFRDAFAFSVETMGTIGYGEMVPESDAAHELVIAQSTLGLLLTALAAGLVVAKFSRPNARLQFSRYMTISPVNGVPTLAFRISNLRSNRIVEAHIRVALVRTEQTAENATFYRNIDLTLSRDRVLSLSRSWMVLHPIDAQSPLYGETPESCAEKEIEFLVTVLGLDDIWMQTVHAGHRYGPRDLVWGARLVDVLSENGNVLTLDLTKFHDIEPTPPTAQFPYSSGKA